MAKRLDKTFRLAFIKKRISSTFKSPALKAALLQEINSMGEDAEVVVQMVERLRPICRPPVQAVKPVANPNAPQPGPAPAAAAMPVAPVAAVVPAAAPAAPAPAAPAPDGNSRDGALEVLDSEDELVQDLTLTSRRERRLRGQLEAWRSRD